MAEHSPYQQKLISRYYDRREEIMLAKLSELVTELYLAETEKRRDSLWQRVDVAMTSLKIKDAIATHILTKRSPEVLASHLKDWLAQSPGK